MHNVNLFLQNHLWLPVMLLTGLLCAAIILLVVLLKKQNTNHSLPLENQQLLLDLRMKSDALSARQQEIHQALHQLPNREDQSRLSDSQTQHLSVRMDALGTRIDMIGQTQEQRLHRIGATLDEKLTHNETRMEKMRETLHQSVTKLQEENSKKLEEMRVTVDEKLHATLDKRLGESFSLVNQRLEQVYKGLGEMQSLAVGVGDLKKVLTNVKSRGVWGEMQLGTLLSQALSPNQYDENVAVVPNSTQRVEFAVRLPGKQDETVYLPIDAKFPVEDYQRLLDALESGESTAIAAAENALHTAIRTEAKRISSKYIVPPYTTDFAIMFLPLEGLYAEALRCRGLTEEMQEKYRVVIAGPTTLNALLTSLQVGFRTLAIEKRSGEVWQLLSAVKTEFSRFTELLEKAHKQLNTVSNSLESASRKSRTITGKLKKVEQLDEGMAARLLGADEDDMTDDPEQLGF